MPHTKSRKVRCLCGFPAFCLLLELNRPRRLTRQIIKHPVNPLHLIDNPAHNLLQHLIRKLGALRRHEIHSIHRSKRHGIIVGALVAHNADGAHIRKRGKVLPDAAA